MFRELLKKKKSEGKLAINTCEAIKYVRWSAYHPNCIWKGDNQIISILIYFFTFLHGVQSKFITTNIIIITSLRKLASSVKKIQVLKWPYGFEDNFKCGVTIKTKEPKTKRGQKNLELPFQKENIRRYLLLTEYFEVFTCKFVIWFVKQSSEMFMCSVRAYKWKIINSWMKSRKLGES